MEAWKTFVAFVDAQDGDATVLEKITDMQRAPIIHLLPTKKSDTIKKNRREALGEKVEAHEPLLFLHARIEQSLRPILPILEKAVEIS